MAYAAISVSLTWGAEFFPDQPTARNMPGGAAPIVKCPSPRGIDSIGRLRQGDDEMRLSARNQLRATVTNVSRGASIANVELDVGGQRVVASITVEAVDELNITEGANVTAVIKASDVMIATDSD